MIHIYLMILLSSLGFTTVAGQDEVRINVLSLLSPRELSVTTTGQLILESESGFHRYGLTEQKPVSISVRGPDLRVALGADKSFPARSLRIQPLAGEDIAVALHSPNPFKRAYRGQLEIDLSDQQLRLILHKDLEDYMVSAAFTEFGYSAESEEAFLAGIVCIRSYVLNKLESTRQADFDLYDHTGDMFFAGQHARQENSLPKGLSDRLEQVAGIVLTRGNSIVPGFFSSSCGGKTHSSRDVWGPGEFDDVLISVNCPWCNDNRNQAWVRTIEKKTIMSALDIPASQSSDIQINKTADSRVFITAGSRLLKDVSSEELRIALGRHSGWDTLPGNTFSIVSTGEILVVAGTGRGHGVGLCQTGAIQQALQGQKWHEILEFYFPKCSLFRLPD